jgi:hypothetical protein
MRNVATPIRNSVLTSTHLRPYFSPKWEKNRPPSGRARNPTAYAANDAISAAPGEMVGKNTLLKISAEAVP